MARPADATIGIAARATMMVTLPRVFESSRPMSMATALAGLVIVMAHVPLLRSNVAKPSHRGSTGSLPNSLAFYGSGAGPVNPARSFQTMVYADIFSDTEFEKNWPESVVDSGSLVKTPGLISTTQW